MRSVLESKWLTKRQHLNTAKGKSEVSKIQRVQNTAARLVLRASRRLHITPMLDSLHWLPVKQRAIYKILLLTYKSIHGLSPAFVSDLVTVRVPPKPVRSSSQCRLEVPFSCTKTYGDRTFAVAAANEWNKLPHAIRQAPSVNAFTSKLKTHLFRQYYVNWFLDCYLPL